MAKALKATGIIIVALLVVAILYLAIADLGFLKPKVEATVSEATGREFRIGGDFSVSVLPSPRIVVEDATLSNPSWASEADMVRIGHFSTNVGLWSLLFRPVVIRELTLRDVTIDLEENAGGARNWEFDRPPPPEQVEKEEGGELESPVDLRHAEISNVTAVYRRPDADDQTFSVERFNLETAEDDVRTYSAAAMLDDLPVSVEGTYSAHVIDLAAEAGEVEFRTTSTFSGNSVDVDLSVGTVDQVGQLLAIEDLPAEDLSLAGDFSLQGQSVLLSGVVVEIGSMQVRIDGTIDGGAATAKLNVNAEGPDLELLRPGLPQIPFALTTEASLDSDSVTLAPLDIEFGESVVSATLSARAGDVPALELTARSPLLDLEPFFPEASDENGDVDDAVVEEGGDRYVFNEDPLPLDTLQKVTADVDIEIDRMRLPTTEYSDFAVTMSLQDGTLEADNRFTDEFGGSFENNVTLIAGGTAADLEVDLNADGLRLVTLAGPGISEEDIPATGAELKLAASGGTPRALASSVNGRVLFMQGPGLINNNILGKISGDILSQLFSALNPLAKDEEFSNWECSLFGIDFESGLGTIEPFLLQGEKIMVVGGGKIDLNTEKLDIEFNTKPREGVGVSADMFVTPFVALSGTLASPRVGLNEKGLLLSGGAAVLTGGMSFLYQGLADRATGQVDQCEKAFEAIGRTIPGRSD